MRFYSNINVTNKEQHNRVFSKQNDAFYVEVDPLDKHNFSTSAENIDIGSLVAVKIQSKAAVVTRKGEHLANNKRYSFVYLFRGQMAITTNLGTARMKENDFILLDNMRDRTMTVNNFVSFIIISAHASEMDQYLPRPAEVVGQLLTRKDHQDRFFFDSLLELWKQIKSGILPDDVTRMLASELLKNIASCYASCYRMTSTRSSQRIQQVKEIIGENLANPELSVGMVANKMNISPRYLRALFTGKEKLSQYILRRRLEECATQLENPLFSTLSVTSIAFNMGFNSTSHFSRTFKNYYGVTPREYRRQHLGSH